MARNKVQFQKGLSEAQFAVLYGTEDQCREAVMRWRWPSGFVCPVCAREHHSFVKTRALYQCTACRRQTSVIAGTIFAATKVPLCTWFRAMYHLTQSETPPGRARQNRAPMLMPPEQLPMHRTLRCGARTRSGRPCRSPAVRGKRRCRMHGGAAGSGAPIGNKNALRHGHYTAEAIAERLALAALIRVSRATLADLGKPE